MQGPGRRPCIPVSNFEELCLKDLDAFTSDEISGPGDTRRRGLWLTGLDRMQWALRFPKTNTPGETFP